METKRLIVSTNYINLHARKKERDRLIESERESQSLMKEKLMKMKIKKKRRNRSRSLQQYSKKSPIILFFLLCKRKKTEC